MNRQRVMAVGRLARAALFAAIAVLWLIPAVAAQTVIGQVEVEGSQRIDPETVRTYLTVAPGDPFAPEKLDQSMKALFATGLFADVALSQRGDVLVVKVVENPIINRISFEGNLRIDDETLLREVRLRERLVFTRNRALQDVDRVQAAYRATGRFNVRVEPKVVQLPQNRVDLIFEISEGPLSHIGAVTFVGNRRFSDGDLRDVIATKEHAWWAFLATGDTYDPDRLTYDRELLREHYLRQGFADFRVLSAVAELAPDGQNFLVTFTLDEGVRYRIGEIAVESDIANVDLDQLRALADTKAGAVYDVRDVNRSITAMTEYLGTFGFAFVEIRPQITRRATDRRLDITFKIGESAKAFVERIDIGGNLRTLDRVIRREFELVEGDAFNTAKLRRSQRRIRNLGYFAKVNIKTRPGSAPDRTVLAVEVEDQATGDLNFGFGFSTIENALVQISLRERNLLGRGQDLRATAKASSRGSQFNIGFTEPYFLNRDLTAGFDLFNETIKEQKERSYDEKRQGGALRIGYDLGKDLRQTLRYRLARTEVTNVQNDASLLVKSQEGSRLVSLVGQTLSYNKLDSRLSPTEGYYASLATQLAGLGGDTRYLRGEAKASYYTPLDEDESQWILGFRGRVGAITGLGEDVRINERFFLGGKSLRGFAPSGVGPRDAATDDALGGNLFYAGTGELSFPLGLTDTLGIRGLVFSDFGSVWQIDADTIGVTSSDGPRASVGVGLSWGTNFGGIRIDLAWPIVKDDRDKTQLFRFSLGSRF
ncbi:MAG: outer membrane protein assembly factor BamA [Alphaproteobacteria bacterium]|nr:outer membrane protein assembly factor BamA [Alphaproteobacteria bacterium]